MNTMNTFSLALALSASASIPLPAQATTARGAESQFVLAAGEHDLRTVIRAAASYLGKNLLMVDVLADDLKVVLQVSQKLDRDGCLAVVTQLAYLHDLVLMPIDADRGMWEFINAHGARRNEAASRAPLLTLEEVRKLKGACIMVTSVIPVQHVSATAAAQTLRPFFATGGRSSLNFGTAGSAIMVSGFADQVLSAAAVIAAIDIPAKEEEPIPDDRVPALEARVAALEAKLRAAELIAAENAKD